MVVKGSSRGSSAEDVARLARHLLARENETAIILEGCRAPADLAPTLAAMRAITLGTRSRRALYHASLSLSADEAFGLDDPRWIEAVDCLERHLGLVGHQRTVVGHSKKGRRHVHVVWCRAHSQTLRIANDSHSYRKHETASRELEARWQGAIRPVVGVHTRPAGTPRPVAAATHRDWQAQERTGIAVADVAAILSAAWASKDSGRAFSAAIVANGIHLAIGRRGIVAIDGAGTPHSIGRRLGLRAAEIQRRLADIDPSSLPTVEACQRTIRTTNTGSMTMSTRRQSGCTAGRRKRFYSPLVTAHRDHWTALGYVVEQSSQGWLVRLSPTTTLIDAGDTLMLERQGEPTDDEIKLMITAAQGRGWDSIRFFGGSESYQRRARELAIAAGYPASAIALECEESKPRPLAMEMPSHVRRKLAPETNPAPAPSAPDTTQPQPTREMRP